MEDIRLSMNGGLDTLRYSAELDELGLTQWELLPGFSHVQGKVSGNLEQAKAKVTVIDDIFPYGDVFQAPLNIKQGEVDIVWQQDEDGWRLWSDKVTAATPDLQVLGVRSVSISRKSKAHFCRFMQKLISTTLVKRGVTFQL